MRKRSVYAVVGLFVFAVVDLLINLLAAAIQQRTFANQFSTRSVWWLAGLSAAGLLLGSWLGAELTIPKTARETSTSSGNRETVTITRLQALLSYGKLRGQGIHLSDILLIGSVLDIDSGG